MLAARCCRSGEARKALEGEEVRTVVASRSKPLFGIEEALPIVCLQLAPSSFVATAKAGRRQVRGDGRHQFRECGCRSRSVRGAGRGVEPSRQYVAPFDGCLMPPAVEGESIPGGRAQRGDHAGGCEVHEATRPRQRATGFHRAVRVAPQPFPAVATGARRLRRLVDLPFFCLPAADARQSTAGA